MKKRKDRKRIDLSVAQAFYYILSCPGGMDLKFGEDTTGICNTPRNTRNNLDCSRLLVDIYN